MVYGTDIGEERIMLKKRDAADAIHRLKKEMAAIERLTGKVAVVADGRLVTTYHQTTSHRRRRKRAPSWSH